jgi:hypothetical protein
MLLARLEMKSGWRIVGEASAGAVCGIQSLSTLSGRAIRMRYLHAI